MIAVAVDAATDACSFVWPVGAVTETSEGTAETSRGCHLIQ